MPRSTGAAIPSSSTPAPATARCAALLRYLAQWLVLHPEWRRAEGAVGQEQCQHGRLYPGKDRRGRARVPQITVGNVRLKNVGVLGIGLILGPFLDRLVGDLFWDSWQKGASGPVVGWLAGNVLRNFKITIDYPSRMA
jgi:hypothetical protein